MAGWLTIADAIVNDPAEDRKELGDPVDFVEHNQAVADGAEVSARVRETIAVGRVLKVEVEAIRIANPLSLSLRMARCRRCFNQNDMLPLYLAAEGLRQQRPVVGFHEEGDG